MRWARHWLGAWVWIVSAGAFLSFAPQASGDDLLDKLLAQYRAHGLPFPPTNAVLSTWETQSHYYVDNQRQTVYYLYFVEPPTDKKDTAHYWLGCERLSPESKKTVFQPAPPTLETFSKSKPIDPYYFPTGFVTNPDLALAIQCKARGWDELARRLLERSKQPASSWSGGPVERWPRDETKALALLAWNYWCNRFVDLEADQRAVVGRLQKLLDGPYGLANKARRTIVADMEQTLSKPRIKGDSLEAAIDHLLDLDFSGGS